MFEVGGMVVHPTHGACRVTDIEDRQFGERTIQYYRMEPLAQTGLTVMVPVDNAERVGLRSAIAEEKLDSVWQVLASQPEALPENHNQRKDLLERKLRESDVYQTAEVVRDLLGRQQELHRLTERGAQLLEQGIKSLAGELAASQGTALPQAHTEVLDRLEDMTAAQPTV